MEVLEKSKLDSFLYMIQMSENPKELVNTMLSDYILTEESVSRLAYCMSKEAFSSSGNLSPKLIKKYPEYFDVDIWKESKNKSMSSILDDNLAPFINEGEFPDIFRKTTEKIEDENQFVEYYSRTPDKAKPFLYTKARKDRVLSVDFLEKNPEFIDEFMFSNPEFVEKLKWNGIEKILREKSGITLQFFLKAILATKEWGNIWKFLDEDPLMNSVKNSVPNKEKDFVSLVKLYEHLPEALIGKITLVIENNWQEEFCGDLLLTYFLEKRKDILTEDFLIQLIKYAEEKSLKEKIASFAIESDYSTAIIILGMR